MWGGFGVRCYDDKVQVLSVATMPIYRESDSDVYSTFIPRDTEQLSTRSAHWSHGTSDGGL